MPTSADALPYLDASALVKLVVPEAETAALSAFVGERPLAVSCTLARAEVVRAVRPQGRVAVEVARALLDRLDLIELDTELLDLAAELDLPVRSLEAIHIAAATELGGELEVLVTYDARMAAAATSLGLPVLAPA